MPPDPDNPFDAEKERDEHESYEEEKKDWWAEATDTDQYPPENEPSGD